MGGLLMLFSMLISLLLWMDLHSSYTLILFLSLLALGWIGGHDDYLKLKHRNTKGLSARKKVLTLSLLASFIALYTLFPSVQHLLHFGSFFKPLFAKGAMGQALPNFSGSDFAKIYFLPFHKNPLFICSGVGLVFAFIMTNVVIIGSSNGVNLTDGLDGLASGCIVLVATVLAVFAFLSNHQGHANYLNILYIEGSGEIAIFLAAMAGAALGFLWYNGHPAQVFMGDTGSIALGGLLGIAAVLLRRELLLLIAGGIFAVEVLSVILQVASFRYRNKKRIFLCTPLHHHFEYKGWPETKVVMRFWLVSIILAIIAISSIKFQ